MEPAKRLGRAIGLGFQIVDDYLDLFGSLAERGRIDSSEVRNNKPTFFNGSDTESGLALLHTTRQQVEDMLPSFGRVARRPEATFESTRKILDEIFSRVKQAA